MSAVPDVHLTFAAAVRRPCRIRLTYSDEHLIASLVMPDSWRAFAMLAAKPQHSHLYLLPHGGTLWMGTGCVDLTLAEAREVRAAFEPLGLPVTERIDRPAAAQQEVS